MTSTTVASIRVPTPLMAAIDAEAERTGKSRNAIIVQALERLKLRGPKPKSSRFSWPYRKMEVGETAAVPVTAGKLHLQALRDARALGRTFTDPVRDGKFYVVTRTA